MQLVVIGPLAACTLLAGWLLLGSPAIACFSLRDGVAIVGLGAMFYLQVYGAWLIIAHCLAREIGS
jgi:hypothetical protein